MPSFRTLAYALLTLLLMAYPARATWSIVIVDLVTGEVAVGIATCLTGFDLRPNTVVVVPGYGVAAAQSFVGPLNLRELIRAQLLNGTPANQILGLLAAADPQHQSRQYGIVGLQSGVATFTGLGAGAWAGGLTGQTGNLVYAIQGNVLTGQPVVTAAETALITTSGSLGDKLMAAMQAARQLGGDGRCSCNSGAPTACGAPPPSFAKSAHIGLMIVSRPSDVDAPCSSNTGCGGGTYWMDLNVANQSASAPDAVAQLQTLYTAWRAQQAGRPDHYQSTVALSGNRIRANGVDTVTGTVRLRDAQGNALGNSLPVSVGLALRSTVTGVQFSPAVPQSDGSYQFTMRGNLDAGTAVLDVSANDGLGRVGIWPQPSVQVDDAFGLCGQGAIPNGSGGTFDALRIGGSAGADRVANVGFAQPFVLSLDPPPGVPNQLPVGLFALWAHLGLPAPGTPLPLPPSGGALCFTPAPLLPGAPTLLVADSFGLGGYVFASGAPWAVGIPGIAALLDVALQGAMVVDPNGAFAATNAVLLRVQPLPAPIVSAVTPLSPLPGQTVTLTGSNFLAGVTARVNGAQVALTAQTPTQLQFAMPAGAPCDSSVAVANPGSAAAVRPINPTPAILGMPYTTSPAAGGVLFVITGTSLSGCTVTIGGNPLNVTTATATAILGTTPPGTPGPTQVVVRNPNGCQTTRPFTYQ